MNTLIKDARNIRNITDEMNNEEISNLADQHVHALLNAKRTGEANTAALKENARRLRDIADIAENYELSDLVTEHLLAIRNHERTA